MMKSKKAPLRMCIVCKAMKEKKELIRIVKTKEDKVFLDSTGKMAGRGAYVCNNDACVASLLKTRALNRAYKCQINESEYVELKAEYEKLKSETVDIKAENDKF
ncbi:MAG: YlxR family protein [Clostridia bacterium]